MSAAYVGTTRRGRFIFYSSPASYSAIFGPFSCYAAAEYMATHNECMTVEAAERLSNGTAFELAAGEGH